MPTWLHDADVYASMIEGGRGPAHDWATTRLALAAPDRFASFPDDERCHDVVLAAGPPHTVRVLADALRTRRPVASGLANAAAALGVYGLLPEDPAELVDALRGALRNDGDEADLWSAHALGNLGAADAAALAAAARIENDAALWVLPVLVLRVADAQGVVDEAAREVAQDLRSRTATHPHLLWPALMAFGVPVGHLTVGFKDPEDAVELGAALAHARPPEMRWPSGSTRRRQAYAIHTLLDGLPGPAAALLREMSRAGDLPPDWGTIPSGAAAWIRAASESHGHGNPLHDVLFHSKAGDAATLSAARRSVGPALRDILRDGMNRHPDFPTALLSLEFVRRFSDDALAESVLRYHRGQIDASVSVAAVAAVAAWHRPDSVPPLLADAGDHRHQVLGLLAAEWAPTTEVLQALLAMPVPDEAPLRLQYARALAAMGDPAVVDPLAALTRADPDGLAEPKALAEEILRTSLGA